jgi:cell wall-associated NlpC family hydrolase
LEIEMLDQIRGALTEIAAQYADTRTQYCRVAADALDSGRCTLAGAVLDDATLANVLDGLGARYRDVVFDASVVRVLRRAQPESRIVATNLAGFYAGPSFDTELVSQLLNGWTLELLEEQERWSFLRQPDGYLGWAFRRYLDAAAPPVATHIVCAPITLLMAKPDIGAAIVTRVPGGAAVAAEPGFGSWSHVSLAGGRSGYAPTSSLRSLDALPGDPDARRAQMRADAGRLIGVPYLWGGCTALGIDCSGFAQLLHRLSGVTIPRDADMQYAAGRPVEPPHGPGDLLFFAEAPGESKVTHVAVSQGGTRLIHSSRSCNGVYEDDLEANADLKARLLGVRSYL